jgi:hypothetical protein
VSVHGALGLSFDVLSAGRSGVADCGSVRISVFEAL